MRWLTANRGAGDRRMNSLAKTHTTAMVVVQIDTNPSTPMSVAIMINPKELPSTLGRAHRAAVVYADRGVDRNLSVDLAVG